VGIMHFAPHDQLENSWISYSKPLMFELIKMLNPCELILFRMEWCIPLLFEIHTKKIQKEKTWHEAILMMKFSVCNTNYELEY